MRRIALRVALSLALVIGAELIGVQISYAQQAPDPRVADIVRTGKLRVGVGLVPTFAIKDPVTGEFRGVAIELARARSSPRG